VRVRVINAVVAGVYAEDVVPELPDFVDVEVDFLDEGPSVIECLVDDALCVPPLLERVKVAAADGVDGIVINCFMDPGLHAARELVHVPVAGPAESAMTFATTLGQTFSVVLPATSGGPKVAAQAREYVGRDRLASVRGVAIPVAELADRDRLTRELVEQCELALADDGAHVLILGCSGMSAVVSAVRRELEERGHDAPVLDPTICAVVSVIGQRLQHVHHSGLAYPLPPWKTAPASA
jgi:allantoin racemase